MAHQSDNSARLSVEITKLNDHQQLLELEHKSSDVWFLVLPYGRRSEDPIALKGWSGCLQKFAAAMGPRSVLAVLTSPQDATATLPELTSVLRFQLWVAVKLSSPLGNVVSHLPEYHAALLILSKYRGSLCHTKTRIEYTFCPACDKTTKDYGGKKHTYHAFGTLMSDVWRDISWMPDSLPIQVFERLADLFGIEPYKCVRVIDLTGSMQLKCLASAKARLDSRISHVPSDFPKSESRLLQGNCLDILKSLSDESIDFCFADPPYNLEKRYDNCKDDLELARYFEWCDEWLEQLARLLKPGRTCAVLNIPQWATRHASYLGTKLQFQNWITWEGLSLPVRMIMPAHYSIICYSKGPSRPIPGLVCGKKTISDERALSVLQESYCLRASCIEGRKVDAIDDTGPMTDLWWDIHRLKHNSRRVDHPCQLPPRLMRRLIALFTKPGEVVLDPFNGAGTTTLCAEEMDRTFIGIELSQRYHELAVQRHRQLELGGNPFAKSESVPRAKNSRVRRIGGITYRVPKKVLQLEVREIAKKLGKMPTRDEVLRHSRHPIEFFDNYFINWGEVCAAARTTGMTETRGNSKPRVGDNGASLFDVGSPLQ